MWYDESLMRFLAVFATFLISIAVPAQSVLMPQVGVANAYQFKSGNSIVIEFPLEFSGLLVNWNAGTSDDLPDYFVIGDGTTLMPFILVDKRPGSVLAKKVTAIKQKIKSALGPLGSSSREKILRYVTEHINDVIDWDIIPNQEIESGAFEESKNKLLNLPIGQWIETKYTHPLKPFEQTINSGKGVCIDMALLASLVLEQFSIKHRLVFGSVQNFYESGGGHTWIELPEGRILDVAWKTLAFPGQNRSGYSDWKFFGNQYGYQYRFAYSFFPLIKF
jgi:hypothetical protein